jgi:hypothetical protein
MQARGVAPAGPPLGRYHTFGQTETDVEVGIPVVDPTAGESRIATGELFGGRSELATAGGVARRACAARGPMRGPP